ncbi:hypothetical protein PQ455_04230 [Sphingomonas naphthae]|uniref:Uncharacterized protein n=1 Tax=Sphingomonas naphthae TaxID=1813468 RepID=A0ABY7TMI6_9SPHN|nr:hypothetical protein [Sphingomonas naphthae]WCT74446.1 hypothetical protein PQ455_04230 [Sphingomonas naphthae]
MRGGALPAALLCVAFALMLAFAPRRVVLPAILLTAGAAVAGSFLPIGGPSIEIAFLACWAILILACALIHLPGGVPTWLALALAPMAGLAAGAVIAGEGARTDLWRALPCLLLTLPARLILARGWQIAIKVVSSWLVAVALLAALLPQMAKTPGYVADHMD